MNLKQTLFVTYYTEGETKGNCEQSMLKAGYKPGYARGHCGTFIVANSCVQKAVDKAEELIKILWEDRISKVISRLQKEIDNTESISKLCLLVNAQKGYMDMQAKNEGKYEADNLTKTEKPQDLSPAQQAIVREASQKIVLLGLNPKPAKESA